MTRQSIVLACATYYVAAVLTLHVLEPEFDPRFRFMSEYALGNYGWLMTTTFFMLGLAIFVVAIGVRALYPASWISRIGFGLLVISAISVCMAGILKDAMPHLLTGAVFFPNITMAVWLLTGYFWRAAGWQTIRWTMLLMALGMLAAFLSMDFDVGMPGLQQRAYLLLLLLWLAIVAHRFVRVTPAQPEASAR